MGLHTSGVFARLLQTIGPTAPRAYARVVLSAVRALNSRAKTSVPCSSSAPQVLSRRNYATTTPLPQGLSALHLVRPLVWSGLHHSQPFLVRYKRRRQIACRGQDRFDREAGRKALFQTFLAQFPADGSLRLARGAFPPHHPSCEKAGSQ